jgi:outer membrane receptor for ferrienterochelin and colicin
MFLRHIPILRLQWIPLLVLLFFCPCETAVAGITGILEGKIRDKQTGEGLPAVNILVIGLNVGAVTDENGFYRIGNIRGGVYDVRVSLMGYKKIVMKGITIYPDLKTRLDLELETASVELPAMEVVAEQPVIRIDQAVTAYQIAKNRIDQLPISKFQEVIGLQPGTTQEGNIRGGKTTDALYLVDGIPIQDVIGGGIGTSLPKSSVNSLTLMTGGLDAEYGNALGGVINVVTRSGDNTHQISFRFERDNWLPERIDKQVNRSLESELTVSGPIIPDRLFYFSADKIALSDTRWWQDFQHYFSSPIDREISGLSKLEYVFSPTLRIGLQGIYSFHHWRDYEYSWRFNLDGLPAETKNSFRLALLLSHSLSNTMSYTVTLSAFSTHSRINDGDKEDMTLLPYEYDLYLRYILHGSRNWWEDTRQYVYSLKSDLTWQVRGVHLVKAGITLNQYHIVSDLVKYEPQLTYFGKPISGASLLNYSNAYDYRPRSGSVYLQDKIDMADQGANVTFGMRWDFLDPRAERPLVEFIPTSSTEYTEKVNGSVPASFKQQISPRIALSFPLMPGSFFFINYGQYFQFPLFNYLYSGLNPVQLKYGTKNVQAGNVDLEPESSTLWEFGCKQNIKGNIVLTMTYFQKNMTNQIDTKTLIPFDSKSAGDYGFASYVNNSSGSAYGFEGVISREQSENISGSLSYTYMVTEGFSDYANQGLNIAQWGFKLAALSYPLSWDQRHTIKADIDFTAPGNIQSNVVIMYNSPRPYTYFPTRDGYTALDTSKMLLPNNARMNDFVTVNCKVSKKFELSSPGRIVLTVYTDIQNLLNRKNIKWMDSEGRIGGELNDPGGYYEPRRVRVGLQIDL